MLRQSTSSWPILPVDSRTITDDIDVMVEHGADDVPAQVPIVNEQSKGPSALASRPPKKSRRATRLSSVQTGYRKPNPSVSRVSPSGRYR